MPGVSDATAALIRLGTKTRTSKDIAETLAELGASLSFGSGQDNGTDLPEFADGEFRRGAGVLAGHAAEPRRSRRTSWTSGRPGSARNIEQAKSQPGFLANDLLNKLLYPGDAPPVHASDGWKRWTRSRARSIMEHYKTYYVPSGEWAGIAGDITPKDAVAKLDKALGAWKGGPMKRVTVAVPAGRSRRRRSI